MKSLRSSRWVLLALLVHLPSLALGFFADDYSHQLVLEGRIESETWRPWSLYDFGTFADAPRDAAGAGAFPWWTDGDWRVRFFRPLTSASLWLDHALFGSSALAGHAVSLALAGLLFLAAGRLYRRLGLAPGAALLAVLVLALDNGALMPIGWIANRNSLLEGLFAVLAVDAALAARERGSARAAAASVAFAAGALLAKESGLHVLVVLAWLLAGGAPRGPARRFPRLAAVCAAGAAAYVVLYAAAGMGSNALFYPLPWTQPGEFAARAAALLACAPVSAFTPFSVDLLLIQPAHAAALLAFALACAVPILWFVARRVRREPCAALCAVWGLAALLPQAGAPPSDRLLFTPMIAWAPLCALYLSGALTEAARDGAGAAERLFARSAAACATVLSGAVLVFLGVSLAAGGASLRETIRTADVGPEELGPRSVFLLQASPSALIALSTQAAWLGQGGSADVRWHVLQAGRRALAWTRTGERSFELETRDEPWLENPFEAVFRTRALPPLEPRAWSAGGFAVRGAADAAGELRRAEFELPVSLDDPRVRFLVLEGGVLRRRAPPWVGETVELPRGFRSPLLP